MGKRKLIIPRRFVRIDSVAGTVSVRGKKGRFKGRKKVKGKGDTTHNRRITRDLDINRDGKVDFFGGTVLGRTKKTVRVRASRRAKGFERRV